MGHFESLVTRRAVSATCLSLVSAGLVLPRAQAAEPGGAALKGAWISTSVESDGKADDDIVGHRLSFAGDRFEIRSKDGKPLFAGTIWIDAGVKPARIDFRHAKGELKGKTWKAIYALDGDSLTICDNSSNLATARPASFAAPSGSGHALFKFRRAGL